VRSLLPSTLWVGREGRLSNNERTCIHPVSPAGPGPGGGLLPRRGPAGVPPSLLTPTHIITSYHHVISISMYHLIILSSSDMYQVFAPRLLPFWLKVCEAVVQNFLYICTHLLNNVYRYTPLAQWLTPLPISAVVVSQRRSLRIHPC